MTEPAQEARSGGAGSTCAVYIYREGALAAVGHDLKLVLTDFTLEVAVDGGDLGVRASGRTGSLRVAGALHGGRAGEVDEGQPSARDRREIERNALRDVLEADRYPVATFRSTAVAAADGAPDRYRIAGALELHGVVRELAFTAERRGDRMLARIPLQQPDFRIKPYRALMGALRVKSEVVLEVSVPFAPREADGEPARKG